jgi:acetyl-CoA C-acetyltransferase
VLHDLNERRKALFRFKTLAYQKTCGTRTKWFTTSPSKVIPKALDKCIHRDVDYFDRPYRVQTKTQKNFRLDNDKVNVNGGAVSFDTH